MKAVILGAGFGTRLEKDIQEYLKKHYRFPEEYSYLCEKPPKQLLLIGPDKIPLITHLFEEIKKIIAPGDIYVVTNNFYYPKFKAWAERYNFPLDNLVNNHVQKVEERKGALGDLYLVIKSKKIADDLLVVAGDTLFYPDFSLEKVITCFSQLDGNLVLFYRIKDDEVSKRGIAEFNSFGKMVGFLEKPQPHETSSRLACAPLYLYKKETLPLLKRFLEEKKSLSSIDAPGLFLQWLYPKQPIYGFGISGRFDVGSLDEYERTNKFFSELKI